MIKDTELREILRATAQQADLPRTMLEPMRRKVARRRARTIGIAFLVAAIVAIGGVQGMRAVTMDDASPGQPAGHSDASVQARGDLIDQSIRDLTPSRPAPRVPYVIDLTTREMTPLPDSIINSLASGKFDRFAVAPNGSSLAFVGKGGDGTPQIFIADIDGTGLRQLTHDPGRATSPAWSPDGTKIAYEGSSDGSGSALVLVDVATGESTQITQTSACPCEGPQFTPDGGSIIYTGGTFSRPVVQIVPVTGGKSVLLIGPGEGLADAGNAALSPDGSWMTFLAGGFPKIKGVEHCGPCRFFASADGSNKRIINGWTANPSGTWSPNSTQIVLADDTDGVPPTIRVVEIPTGETSSVARGRVAVWLDEHRLLVDV